MRHLLGRIAFGISGPQATSCLAMQGQAVDIRIHAEEMRRMANRLYEIYSKHTGQPVDVIGESHHDLQSIELTSSSLLHTCTCR